MKTPLTPCVIALSDRISIRVLKVETVSIDPSWTAANVQGTFWRFYANASHGAAVSVGDETFAIEPGSLTVIPPWACFSCHCRHPVEHFYVHVDIIGIPGILIRNTMPAPLRIDDSNGVLSRFNELRGQFPPARSPDFPAWLTLKGAVSFAIAELIRQLSPQARGQWERLLHNPLQVAPALALIEQRPEHPPGNAELAAACHLSPDHFTRRFRALVGQTPHQYVLEHRLALAARMLVFGSDTIDTIAEATGFANRYHFTRVFSARFGVPPATYRRTSKRS